MLECMEMNEKEAHHRKIVAFYFYPGISEIGVSVDLYGNVVADFCELTWF
jgi:hypothetical protein